MPPQSDLAAGNTVLGDELQSYLSTVFSSAPHNVLLFFQDKVSDALAPYSHVQLLRERGSEEGGKKRSEGKSEGVG